MTGPAVSGLLGAAGCWAGMSPRAARHEDRDRRRLSGEPARVRQVRQADAPGAGGGRQSARVRRLRRPAVERVGRRPGAVRAGRRRRRRGAQPGGVEHRAAVARGPVRDGPRRGPGAARPDLLPGHLQLLPRLGGEAGHRDDARHARPGPPGPRLPDLERPGRLGDQGAPRGAAGGPDLDRLGVGTPRPPRLVPAARRPRPRHQRGARPGLRPQADRPRIRRRSRPFWGRPPRRPFSCMSAA